MCCHNGHRQKALHDALGAIDPSIASPSEFFHLKGRESDGGVKVSVEEAEKALDATFIAAISGDGADPDDEDSWAAVDADERLEQHVAWMRARNDLIEEGMTSGMVAALAKYVSDKHDEAESAKEVEIAKAVRERGNKMSPRTKVLVGTLSLLTLASMTGSALGVSSAATSEQAPIAATQQVASADMLAGQQFTVGGKSVYIGAVKGKCAPGTVKVTNPKTQTLKWVKGGKVISKKVAKGVAVCKFISKGGTVANATTNASGAITALPSNFPKNPTAADIASLGLSPTSKVSPNLRIPQPTGSSVAPAQLAAKVRPVGVTQVGTIEVASGLGTVQNRVAYVEWEFTGGSGVVAAPTGQVGADGMGVIGYTKLNPNGVTRIVQPIILSPDPDTGRIQDFFFGDIQPDYGQANLPSSVVQDWKLPTAKDKSGSGHPVGITANPGYWNQAAGPRDGFVNLNIDGTMFGNYSY